MSSSSASKKEDYIVIPCKDKERRLYSGWKFTPTDEELVTHYLVTKARGLDLPCEIIREFDLYSCHPDELSMHEFVYGNKNETYFFTSRAESNGTTKGYWKDLGKDKEILQNGKTIAYKRKLVFYSRTPSEDQKTGYQIYEYRLDPSLSTKNLVLCKVQLRMPEEDE